MRNRYLNTILPLWSWSPAGISLETYHDRMKAICDQFVHPNDRASFMYETDPEVLSKTLTKESPVRFVNFREQFGDSIVYYQGKYVLLDN